MTEPTLEDQLAGALNSIGLLQEALADVEASFAREDAGWTALGSKADQFTHKFRTARAADAVAAAAFDPLLKRALNLRVAYIWAGGVQVSTRDDAEAGQDVNAVVRAFWGDEDVQQTFSSVQALIEHERQLGTHGELFLALPTDPRTGRVRVRSLPPEEFDADPITDPEDAARVWYYPRTYTPKAAGATARTVLYPAASYRPAIRPKTAEHVGAQVEVRWDAPILHVAVNEVGGRGVGDLWAALPWAKAYKGFLSDWAGLMRALARIAVKVTTRGDKVQQATSHLATITQPGGGVGLTHGDKLEALNTSGARFDADSGRPLAVMVAAALDLPVTTLLGDPGATGARAVAENVSEESWSVFSVRQDLWASVIGQIVAYAIDQAALAPLGGLRGTIRRDGDRQYVDLPEGDDRTIIVAFPEHDTTDMLDKVRAIVQASQTETLPPLTVARLLMQALEVPDLDDVLALITDDEGNFVPLDVLDAHVRQRIADRGGLVR